MDMKVKTLIENRENVKTRIKELMLAVEMVNEDDLKIVITQKQATGIYELLKDYEKYLDSVAENGTIYY